MSVTTAKAALIDAASALYRPAGRFAYYFARGKLQGDPAFTALLERGLLSPAQRVVDLGCGQGLLAAWLLAARSCHDSGIWPAHWPAPPVLRSFVGVELMPRDVARARQALGPHAEIVKGDIREVNYRDADAIVILDVLHYMTCASQEETLARVRAALDPAGTLLLRVGDPEGGWRFRMGDWWDRTATFIRGHRLPDLYYRPVRAWRELLSRMGFRCEALPMSEGTPFSNVLLVARPA